jgi:hypothetical protein
MNLALIVELGLVHAAESCQAQLTLRIVREELLSKHYDCRIEYPSVGSESEAIEKICRRSRNERVQSPGCNSALPGVLDLPGIEFLDRKRRWQILPTLPSVRTLE